MRLHNVALDQFGANAGPGPWDDDLDDIPAHYFDGGEFIVGSFEGRLVAMGAFRRVTNETAELKCMRVRVLPDCQRRGFGGQILAELEETAKGLGYSRFVLDTLVIQEPAQAFYRKNGYTETRRDPSRSPAIVFFEKEL